jgi:GrpB-like predicted nucleotidyltransferase (UPF0157 family)
MMRLGLRTGEVVLLPYQPDWIGEFVQAAAGIHSQSLPQGAQIEHVGSTAVPGLTSKPIIDIAVGLSADDDTSSTLSALEAIGYRYRGYREDAGGHVLDFREGEYTTRHIHVVLLSSRQWRRYIMIRDYLRTQPGARARYASAKCHLAATFSHDRRGYTAAKRAILDQLFKEAEDTLPEASGVER